MNLSSIVRTSVHAVLIGGLALLFGCAGQVAPSGGPLDTTPPSVIYTEPDTNAVRVNTQTLEIEFDKYVDRRSVEESIFISPYVGALEFDWSGRTVRAAIAETLRAGKTYVVMIGTDVVDLRVPANHLRQGFTLAFSTGDSLDRGVITGRIVDEKPEGIMVYVYGITNINPDTLNPGHTKPDYLMQTGTDGRFTLTHMAFGKYRLIAVRDEYRDLKYDKQIDGYGVWRRDIELGTDHPSIDDIAVRMTKEDTTRPFLSNARALAPRRIIARFGEPIDSLSLSKGNVSIVDTLSGDPAPILYWYLNYSQPSEIGIVTSSSLDSGHTYWVKVQGFTDLAGNSVDTLHAQADFFASGGADTLHPRLTSAIADSMRDVAIGIPLSMTVTKPVIREPMVNAIQLADSLAQPVPAEVRWRGGQEILVMPRTELQQAAWYTLRVGLDSLRDVYGVRAYRDSTLVVRFKTQDLRMTGNIAGVINAATGVQGPFVVTALRIDPAPVVKKKTVVKQGGPFTIDRLPEGRYALEAFQMKDSLGTYQYGLPYPFMPSAPFGVSRDTVKVRARWGVQGVSVTVE
jgi:uncharacterized protein (DUF2141 family)